MAIDAVQEARLVEAARGRQDREGGPFDAIRQGLLGQIRFAQPPQRSFRVADPHEVGMVVAPQLLAKQRREHHAARRVRPHPPLATLFAAEFLILARL